MFKKLRRHVAEKVRAYHKQLHKFHHTTHTTFEGCYICAGMIGLHAVDAFIYAGLLIAFVVGLIISITGD